jgi:RimJ/RimL family protein N-acetyltransferase
MKIQHADVGALAAYATHLKRLSETDRYTRFCYNIKDEAIDQFILSILYHPDDHHLFTATLDDNILGFGHLAREGDNWELAVSVEGSHQGKGVADKIMNFMIDWGTTRGVHSVFMHCITQNAKIQHLARKHGLRMVERDGAEVTSRVDLPLPTPMNYTADFMREQRELLEQMTDIQRKLFANLNPLTYVKEHTLD